jgi:hypothetical protein
MCDDSSGMALGGRSAAGRMVERDLFISTARKWLISIGHVMTGQTVERETANLP